MVKGKCWTEEENELLLQMAAQKLSSQRFMIVALIRVERIKQLGSRH